MLNQIQRTATLFLLVFRALLIVIPLMVCLQWFFTDIPIIQSWVKVFGFFDPIKTDIGGFKAVWIADHIFTLKEKWIGFGGTMIGLSPLFLAITLLIPIFKNYRINNIFSLTNAKYYQKLGYVFFYDSLIAKPICQALLTIAATLSNPPGQQQIMITFGMINLESIFCGAIIIVITRVMYMGNKLQEEQRLVI